MRAKSSDQLLRAAEAIRLGGVRAIEVTMNTPGALGVIEQAVKRNDPEIAFGAGTVLEVETARAAILAGAQFIIAPGLKSAVIALCRDYSIPVLPGAYTPTEILAAWENGADMVKVFPASAGGPSFIKALRAPLDQIELVPVGGVTLENTAEFIRAGSAAVGIGSDLVDTKLLESRSWTELTARAQQFVNEVQRGRG